MKTMSWLAGLLEAEGCFTLRTGTSISIEVVSTDKDVIEAAATLLKSKSVRARKPIKAEWKTCYITSIKGKRAIQIVTEIYSVMSNRRKSRIRELLGYEPSTDFDCNWDEWLAGVLEGEGSFLPGPPSAPRVPRLQMVTTDEDTAQLVADLIGTKRQGPYKVKNPRAKPFYSVRLKGGRAVILMKSIKPLMGIRRQESIERAIDSFVGTRSPYKV